MILPFVIFLSSIVSLGANAEPPNQPDPDIKRPAVVTYAGLQKMAGLKGRKNLVAGAAVTGVGQSSDGPGPDVNQTCVLTCESDLYNAYLQCAFGVAGPPPQESIYQCQAYADQEFFNCIAGCQG